MSDLAVLQQRIGKVRASRGFSNDPLKIQLLLTEEVGEISAELKRLWSKHYGAFSRDRLADEISDVLVMLSALASTFDIDLEQALEKKFFGADARRPWNAGVAED